MIESTSAEPATVQVSVKDVSLDEQTKKPLSILYGKSHSDSIGKDVSAPFGLASAEVFTPHPDDEKLGLKFT
jgi:hypothetical protein